MPRQVAEPQTHCFEPVFDEHSRILVLGSFPSVRSRAEGFYYGNPRNRFWQMLSDIFAQPLPADNTSRRELLLSHGIALWDVIAQCEISGSSDASIRAARPNDIKLILDSCSIERILANGATAYAAYNRLCAAALGRDAIKLPSTSPANATWSLERLTAEWRRYIVN